jgi:hypothetical protein
MSKSILAAALAVALVPALAGCSSLRNTFGAERGGPDEFMVVRHAPLTLPPDYNLRPPQPGVPRPQEPAPTTEARSLILGTQSGLVVGQALGDVGLDRSSGESALLQEAGAGRADPSIRETLNQEAGLAGADRSFLDSLIFWKQADTGEVVDPAGEAARLKTNAEAGLPPTAGQTPVIKRKKRGLLEGLF